MSCLYLDDSVRIKANQVDERGYNQLNTEIIIHQVGQLILQQSLKMFRAIRKELNFKDVEAIY